MDLDNLKPTNRPSSIVHRQSQSAANQKLEAGSRKLEAGFTLIELMIVVSILGILAAIVYPEFQGHVQQAKEAQAKANLKLLREAIERYAADHNGVPPGYLNGIFVNNSVTMVAQLLYCTSSNGDTILQKTKSGSYEYGPYLNELPKNPFTQKDSFLLIADNEPMPASPTENHGWIYKPKTKEIRLDSLGIGSKGTSLYNY